MLNLVIRTFLIYIAVIVVMRLMGKRQVGQLQPFEMVVSIIIADLAAMPMQDEKIPLLRGIIPLIVLLFAQVVFSFIVFRNKRFRTWLNGTPSVLIAHGKINHKILQECMVSFSDLLEAMHASGISSIEDIDYAILETDGNISCFQKPHLTPVQKMDMNVKVENTSFSLPLVMNGEFLQNYMEFSDKTQNDILSNVKSAGKVLSDVLYSYVEPDGTVKMIYKRDENRKRSDRK